MMLTRTKAKWSFAVVVLGLMLNLFLAACGDATSTTAPATTAASNGAAAGAATTAANTGTGATTAASNSQAGGAPVDINLWALAAVTESQPPPADWEGYKIIRDKLNINLKFTILPAGTDGETKLNVAAAGNNFPDLTDGGNFDLFYKWQQQGLLAPVDSLLPMMPERTKMRYSDQNLNKLMTVNGKMYGLQEPNPIPNVEGLVIRKDWLDKLGLKPPTTLDELLEVAKAFTEKDPDGNGKNDTYGYGAIIEGNFGLGLKFDYIYGAYGVAGATTTATGDWNLSDPAKFGLNLRDPGYEKATEFIKKMVDAKVIDPDWPTMKKDDFRARWKQGKYGIMWENFCALICKSNYTDFDNNFPNGEWMMLPAPKGPDGKSTYGAYVNLGKRWLVSKKALDSGKGQAIARLLEWANSGEGYYLLGFGKEGVNYKKDESGNVITEGVPAPYTAKEQQPLTQLRNMAYFSTPVELKTRYVDWKTKNGRTLQPLQLLEAYQKQPWINATPTLAIKPAPQQADINRYVSENMVQFVLGQKPLNDGTWKEFLNGLNGLGVTDWEASAKKAMSDSGFLK
jgi:putative aldouronate transport system substrate-binding protein